MPREDLVSLETLKGGAVLERFHDALAQVVANVADPNTKADAARTITITVKFKPDDHRSMAAVGIEVATKLAPPAPLGTSVFLGVRNGEVVATEYNPNQPSMFDVEEDQRHIDRKRQSAGDKE